MVEQRLHAHFALFRTRKGRSSLGAHYRVTNRLTLTVIFSPEYTAGFPRTPTSGYWQLACATPFAATLGSFWSLNFFVRRNPLSAFFQRGRSFHWNFWALESCRWLQCNFNLMPKLGIAFYFVHTLETPFLIFLLFEFWSSHKVGEVKRFDSEVDSRGY